MPNDPTLHEFRALVLFAQGQYDAAAATLYPVLNAGPGWDWTTLVGLYPERRRLHRAAPRPRRRQPGEPRQGVRPLRPGVQLPDRGVPRERRVRTPPGDPAPAQGHPLRPPPGPDHQARDRDPRRRRSRAAGDVPPAHPPSPAVAPVSNGPTGSLIGHLVARSRRPRRPSPCRSPPTAASTGPSPTRTAPASSPAARPTATTCSPSPPSTGDPLVGRVVWTDATHFTFQAVGGGAGDPGLAFQKTDG